MPEYLNDKKHTYSIDFKIYEPANIAELPFALPIQMNNNSVLKLGYHNVKMVFSEDEFDDFCEQVGRYGVVIKMIGSERLD